MNPEKCGSVGCVSFHNVKGLWFDSLSGALPALRVHLVGAHTKGHRSMFLPHMAVPLPLFIPPFPPSKNK